MGNTTSGLVPLPTEDEIQLENPSLHAVLAVAYDDDSQRIAILNSWETALVWKDISSCIMTIT